MSADQLTVIADRGYFKNMEMLACDYASIKAVVTKSLTSGATTEGRIGRDDFIDGASLMKFAVRFRRDRVSEGEANYLPLNNSRAYHEFSHTRSGPQPLHPSL